MEHDTADKAKLLIQLYRIEFFNIRTSQDFPVFMYVRIHNNFVFTHEIIIRLHVYSAWLINM
jgi:hypothetical protein